MIAAVVPAVLVGTLSTPVRLLEVASALVLVVVVYAVLVSVERKGYRAELLTVIVGLIAFESILWDQNFVPVGIFHPTFSGQNFRLYDVLIPIALVARLRVNGLPKRISALGGAVFLFCAWYTGEAVIGVMRGYGFNNVVYEAKLVIYVGGAYVLAAGVRAEDILGPHGIRRLARPFALVTVGLIALTGSSGLNIPIPTMNVSGLQGVEPDAATFLFCLGVITLLVELASPRRRPTMVAAGLVLIISAVASHQRAAVIALIAGAAFAAVGWLWPVKSGRAIRLTPTEVVGAGVLIFGGMASYPLLNGRSPLRLSSLPLGSLLSATFGGTEKTESTADRAGQLHAALPVIMQHPIIGWGLAKTITYVAVGQTVTTPSPDNVYLSILLRTGLLGFVLFAALVVAAIVAVVRVWRIHPEPRVAALAWACGATIAAVLARGAVEGIFEKYRIAIELGLALGMARSAAVSLEEWERVAPQALSPPPIIEPTKPTTKYLVPMTDE